MQCGIFLGDSVLGCGARIGSGVITKFNQTEVYVKDNAGGVSRTSGVYFSQARARYPIKEEANSSLRQR